jgi:hypothetical protein
MHATNAVEKISMLTAVVMCRLTCTMAIVIRISASWTMMTIHCGGEIAASLRRMRSRRACSAASTAFVARL